MNKQELLDKWTEFYDNVSEFEDLCYESMAFGFFCALGADPDLARDLYQECIKIGKF